MKLPYKPTNVYHRHGGAILEVTSIRHQTDKPRDGRSRDAWYFMGRVKWRDGSGDESKLHPIDAPMMCADTDEGHAEIRGLSELMMEYLREHGDWCGRGSKHEGWYAHRKAKATA